MRKSPWTSLWRGVYGLGNGVSVTDIHARPGNRLNSALFVMMRMRSPVAMPQPHADEDDARRHPQSNMA